MRAAECLSKMPARDRKHTSDLSLSEAIRTIARRLPADKPKAPKPKAPAPGTPEYERDRKEYVALYQKAQDAERELAKHIALTADGEHDVAAVAKKLGIYQRRVREALAAPEEEAPEDDLTPRSATVRPGSPITSQTMQSSWAAMLLASAPMVEWAGTRSAMQSAPTPFV